MAVAPCTSMAEMVLAILGPEKRGLLPPTSSALVEITANLFSSSRCSRWCYCVMRSSSRSNVVLGKNTAERKSGLGLQISRENKSFLKLTLFLRQFYFQLFGSSCWLDGFLCSCDSFDAPLRLRQRNPHLCLWQHLFLDLSSRQRLRIIQL